MIDDKKYGILNHHIYSGIKKLLATFNRWLFKSSGRNSIFEQYLWRIYVEDNVYILKIYPHWIDLKRRRLPNRRHCCSTIADRRQNHRYHIQYNRLTFNQNLSLGILYFGETLPWYSIHFQIIHNKMTFRFTGITIPCKRRIFKWWKQNKLIWM